MGELFEYVVCILCGRNRVLESQKGKLRWDFIKDLKTTKILQLREQHAREIGVKPKGFTLVEAESLTLLEMLHDPVLSEVVEDILRQYIHLGKELRALNLIEEDGTLREKLENLIANIHSARRADPLGKATRLKKFAKEHLEPLLL